MLTVMTYNVGAGLAAPLRLVEVLRQSGAELLSSDYPHQVLHATDIPGKGLISRFPVREYELLELHPGRPDLQVLVAAPGGELTVIVAHPPPPRIGRNRMRQAALADQQ